MKVLVVGATGMVGGTAAKMLAERGESVRALVRTTSEADKKTQLTDAGVETVEGDLRDEGSLNDACEGIDVVISTVSAMPFSWKDDNSIGIVDRDGQIRLIDAAKKASVKRFVYVSFPHDPQIHFPLGEAKAAVEAHLKKGGIEYVILRANFFMEVWLSPAFGFDFSAGTAAVFGEGKNPLSWVSYADVARSAADAVTSTKAVNVAIPVGGPEALSPLQVIEVFKTVNGKEWKVEHVPADALKKQMQEAPDEVQKSVAGLQVTYATAQYAMDPEKYLVTDGLKSLQVYAKEVLG